MVGDVPVTRVLQHQRSSAVSDRGDVPADGRERDANRGCSADSLIIRESAQRRTTDAERGRQIHVDDLRQVPEDVGLRVPDEGGRRDTGPPQLLERREPATGSPDEEQLTTEPEVDELEDGGDGLLDPVPRPTGVPPRETSVEAATNGSLKATYRPPARRPRLTPEKKGGVRSARAGIAPVKNAGTH